MSQGDHYDQETKDLAYQLYTYEAGGNYQKLRLMLAAGYGDYDPVEVPLRTLQDWGVRYGWQDRALRDVASIVPALYGQAVSEYIIMRAEAARTIRQIMNDETVDPKVRLQAAIAAADRSGDSPLNRSPEKTLKVELAETMVDVSALPSGQIRDHETQLLDQLKQARVKRSADGTSR